jgi:hypothetical protein
MPRPVDVPAYRVPHLNLLFLEGPSSRPRSVLWLVQSRVRRMYRIYFDSNNSSPHHDGYPLSLPAAKEDLARIPGGPRQGMRVVIYMTGELEMEAVLSFDPKWQVWMAVPIAGTTKIYPEAP